MHCDYQGKGLVYGPFLGGCLCVELKFNTHSTLIFFLQIKASPKNDSTFYLGGESLHMSNINVVESSSLYTVGISIYCIAWHKHFFGRTVLTISKIKTADCSIEKLLIPDNFPGRGSSSDE